MKKTYGFCLMLTLVAAFFALGGTRFSAPASAQKNVPEKNLGPTQPAPGDADLAAMIKRLTNRSTDDLVQSRAADNSVSLDLGEGFQNVVLARTGKDGEPITACVTSLAEANDFLGRDLETGAPIYSRQAYGDDTAEVAARHGMSAGEYRYYQNLIAAAAAQRAASPNTATLNIVNADGASEGFNDPTVVATEGGNPGTTRGAQRLNLFTFAAGIWGAFLDTSVPINISSQFNPLTPCSTAGGVLGAAGAATVHRDFANTEVAGTWYHVALASKRAGTDLNGATPEINATFNTNVDAGCLGIGTRFYYGLNNSTPSNRVNLLIVLLHEMGHGLGFSSFVNGSTGALLMGFPDGFLLKMFDRTTGKFWSSMTNAERQTSALNNGNVVWDGPNVRIAAGYLTNGSDAQGRVQLYTPSTFAPGSSVSHFDTVSAPNLLMEPAISVGLPLDLDLTRQVTRDLGWYRDTTANLVPDRINIVRVVGDAVIGSSRVLKWNNFGGSTRPVTIELSTDNGLTYPTALATNLVNTGDFTFTIPNTPTTQARIRVREAGFAAPVGSYKFTIATTFPPYGQWNYIGNLAKASIAVFAPGLHYAPTSADWYWYLLDSETGEVTSIEFGEATDVIVPGNYDGDNRADVAVWRPSTGVWQWINSSDETLGTIQFGANGDIPVPGDYDGDGSDDVAVWRPSNGVWYRLDSSTGESSAVQFGVAGDKPTLGDFDGDGKYDIAVYRPSTGVWYRLNSANGSFFATTFGLAEDLPTPADYDGDGRADLSVFRPSNGTWYRLNSSNGSFAAVTFGTVGDKPVPADYDGDGKSDVAVFRPSNGVWYLLNSTAGFSATQFGSAGDRPIPNAYVY